jgi:hypothetical protein
MTFAFSGDWCSAEPYRYVHDLDRAGFAWELLRRNPSYCGEAVVAPRISSTAGGYARVEAPPAHGPRWGLSFRTSG